MFPVEMSPRQNADFETFTNVTARRYDGERFVKDASLTLKMSAAYCQLQSR